MAFGGVTWRSVLLLPVLWGSEAQARVDIAPTAVTIPLAWSGGDLVVSRDFCVPSTQEPAPSGTTIIPYRVIGNAPFSLASGANQIPFSVIWQDLYAGQSRTLSPNVPTAFSFTGATAGCPSGNNGRLMLTLPEASLYAAPPGAYTTNFVLDVENTGAGRKKFKTTVTLNLNLPGLIRISQLNDINLGIFDGINNMQASDTACVFRNLAGNYGVRVSGQGAGGAFVLVNGASQVPFSATWNDGTGAAMLTPNVLLSGRRNVYTASGDCAGGAANNATLGVSALAADINNATVTGAHVGQLTILVEMQ